MPHIEELPAPLKGEVFQKVLAGKISVQDFFTNPKHDSIKKEFMDFFKAQYGKQPEGSLFSDEAVAAAWIAKLRFNQDIDDKLFFDYIKRSEEIFNHDPKEGNLKLNLQSKEPQGNDLCAIMWGIEALNGVQSFDTDATRIRLPQEGPTISKEQEHEEISSSRHSLR